MPSLLAKQGPLAGQRLEVESELTVGRLDADVVVPDDELSRRHAVFRAARGVLEVEDLGSTNGTFVEGRRIDAPTRIDSGATVSLGTSVFVAEVAAPAQPTILDHASPGDVPAAQTEVVRSSPPPPPPTAISPHPVRTAVPPPPPAAAAAPLAAPPAQRGPGAAPPRYAVAALGAFSPPSSRRGGLATRSWVPVGLSYASVLLTAIALVVYFASR